MDAQIRILTDDLDLGAVLRESARGLGYDCVFVETISKFRSVVFPAGRYFLVSDYLLGVEGVCSDFLLSLLKEGPSPSGVLVMSGFYGFERQLAAAGVHERYRERRIRVLTVEKPFDQARFGELLLLLTSEGTPQPVLSRRSRPLSLVEIFGSGDVLRLARENLGLSRGEVAQIGSERGLSLDEARLDEIEADQRGVALQSHEWFILAGALYESGDVCQLGFDRWAHLRRVRDALKAGAYPYPKNLILKEHLLELAAHEKLGHALRVRSGQT